MGDKVRVQEFEINGGELIDRVKEIIKEPGVQRMVVYSQKGTVLLNLPLATGAAVGTVGAIMAPMWSALLGIAAMAARIRVEIVRRDEVDAQVKEDEARKKRIAIKSSEE